MESTKTIEYKKIPYYGKTGSIHGITIEGNIIIVERYDNKGNINSVKFVTPNKRGNYEQIAADYYTNVSEYLTKNQKKYEKYKSKKTTLNKFINKQTISKLKTIAKSCIALGIFAVGVSMYFSSISILLYLSTGFLIVSSVETLMLSDVSKELVQQQFIVDYEEFDTNLAEYNTTKDQNQTPKTKYRGVTKDGKKPINDFSLTKKLTPTTNKIAA